MPLADPKGAAKHDIDAMLAAASNPGVIYICNPNNPTGTCTPHAEIEKAVANAPKDTIILIDEAYVHLCDEPRSLHFVQEGKNVIVLRTFSKLYGMAGIRMGFAVGRPDLLAKMAQFSGQNSLPITAVVAAKASLLDPDLVPTRKKIIADIRNADARLAQERGLLVHSFREQLLHARRASPRQRSAGCACEEGDVRGSHLARLAAERPHYGRNGG